MPNEFNNEIHLDHCSMCKIELVVKIPTKDDFAYTPSPPHTLNVSNISAVTDLILMKF